MTKATITTEKTTEACKNGTCGHAHEFTVPLDENKPTATLSVTNATPNQTVQVQVEKPSEKETRTIEKIPSYLPKYKCKNCDTNHKNPNYTHRPKGKCKNCDQFSKDATGKCPWCDKEEIEPIDEDDLDELGIPEPEEHIHEEE